MKSASRQRRGRRAWQTGHLAEWAASLCLMMKGYRILKRRYKTCVGEIDLIAKRGKMLCFVEVKKRTSLEDALYAITPHQQARLVRAAEHYLQRHPFSGNIRFDGIVMTAWRWPRHITHILVMA